MTDLCPICHTYLSQSNVLLLQACRFTCLSIISESPTSLRRSQITVSRRPLFVYRMTSCVQWTIRTLSLCCSWSCRPHLSTIVWCYIDCHMMLEWSNLHYTGLSRIWVAEVNLSTLMVVRHLLALLRVESLNVLYSTRSCSLFMQHHHRKLFGTTTSCHMFMLMTRKFTTQWIPVRRTLTRLLSALNDV